MQPDDGARTTARIALPSGPGATITLLAVVAIVSCVAFLTVGARGPWSFVLPLRGTKLAALLAVATSIAVSTVLFQTITGNRILTPAIIGFDALFALIKTGLVFALGAGAVAATDPRLAFLADVVVMIGFALALFRLLFAGSAGDLHRLLLAGVVCGVFFRSIAGLLQRLINPADFVTMQDRLFANFNTVAGDLVGIALVLMLAAGVAILAIFRDLDAVALGRDTAVSLGVDHARLSRLVLIVVSVLVSVSTALVGPVTFFGLLVAGVAQAISPDFRHRHLLPIAVLVAVVGLVGGQMVLERLLGFGTVLSVVVEFAGGAFFLFRLIGGRVR